MLSTPLGQHILDYDPPRGFSIPPFAMYDSSSDPYDHMLHYNQAMILNAGDDQLLCKVFPASLKGLALAWFHKLPRRSINTFGELWAAFVSQYLCSVKKKGNVSSLQSILKREDLFLWDKICFSLSKIILLWDKICFSLSRIILLRDNICLSL